MSPETSTNYTLVERGWRLTSGCNPDGTVLLEWHCPQCWKVAQVRRRSGTDVKARR